MNKASFCFEDGLSGSQQFGALFNRAAIWVTPGRQTRRSIPIEQKGIPVVGRC